MNEPFVILHLSDAHIGHPDHTLDSSTVLEPLISDVADVSKKEALSPNLIVFNGDLAYGHLKDAPIGDQYDLARKFLTDVCSALKTSFDRTPVLLVPGNHDINRDKIDPAHTDWIAARKGSEGATEIYKAMQKDALPWRAMKERQKEWWQFTQTIPNQPWKWDDQLLASSGHLNHNGQQIGIIGLNSSWASYTQSERGRLWVGQFQFQKLNREVSSSEFKIAVSHHPLSWLNDADELWLRDRIETTYDIFMHGHEHLGWIRDSEKHLSLAAGACYEGSAKTNAYSWVVIDFAKREARVIYRTYTDRGKGGWGPFYIPGRTNELGIGIVRNLFPTTTPAPPIAQGPSTPASILHSPTPPPPTPPVERPTTVYTLVQTLEDRFSFRWEPETFLASNNTIVYWPIRLRAPTPIHAVQAFAAAGLQRLGATISLWLDELGTKDYNIDEFFGPISRWFGRAGGDTSKLKLQLFSSVLSEDHAPRVWPLVRRWLGTTGYRLDEVMKVSKLWPDDSTALSALDQLSKQRPRKLLTPAAVWACLKHVHDAAPEAGILTLSGYDEQPLWKAWHDCAGIPSARIGHLYIPQLLLATGQSPVHMQRTDIAWKSKEDIRKAVNHDRALADSNVEPLNPNRLIPWCLQGCVLLPSYVHGETPYLEVSGRQVHTLRDFADIDASESIPSLIEAVAKWLL